MPELPNPSDVYTQFMALPPARRALLVATAAGSLLFFAWVSLGTVRVDDQVLFRGLPEAEVARVIDALEGEGIAYTLADGGTTVKVPSARLHEARIRVASRGLPMGGGVGFELFDRPGFGVTDFVHRVNYQRALQGELARSVEQLAPVARARVQLALPDRSPFVGRRKREPSASVVLRTEPGHELASNQVAAIVHLVSSSVEELKPERVSVVDDRGQLLSAQAEGAVGAAAPPGTRSYQARLESDLARRIEAILEPTVGAGRVVATVSADLDWTQTETTEERYDPNSQIERSEQRTEETSSEGGLEAGGVPGARANTPGGDVGAPGAEGAASKRTTETINYELSKRVIHSRKGIAQLERLSAAVLVDGKPVEGEGADFEPWAAEDLKQFEALARQAVGFSEERGDELVLTSAPFRTLEFAEDAAGGGLSPGLLLIVSQLLRYGMLIGVVALFGLLVVKPLARSVESGGALSLPARVADLQAQQADGAGEAAAVAAASGADARTIDVPGDDAVKALRTWLRQG